MILLLVGPPGSGKTTVRTHLEDQGWTGYEASLYIKRAMLEYEATDLRDLVNKAGNGVAARAIWQDIERHTEQDSFVISGFRTSFEVNYIKSKAQAMVIGLYTDIYTCYERVKQRKRSSDEQDFDIFQQRVRDDYSLGIADLFQNNVDIFIKNDLDILSILEKIIRINSIDRPKWKITLEDIKSKISVDSRRNFVSYQERIAIANLPRV